AETAPEAGGASGRVAGLRQRLGRVEVEGRKGARRDGLDHFGVLDSGDESGDTLKQFGPAQQWRMALTGNGDGFEARMRLDHRRERRRRQEVRVLAANGEHRAVRKRAELVPE